MFEFVGKRQISKSLNLSSDTLRKYRLEGVWLEGIHWIRINSRCVRYNAELIQDWAHNRQNPTAHRRAVEIYQASLLNNRKKRVTKS